MSEQPQSPESNTPSPTASSSPWPIMPDLATQVLSYWVDAWQRTILFWDVLRQRSDQYSAQKAKAVPHVLSFDTELVLDGRSFDRPVNYGLVRIKPPEGVVIDPKKRPFVVVDPRAGHGAGIGGFKADSELGQPFVQACANEQTAQGEVQVEPARSEAERNSG